MSLQTKKQKNDNYTPWCRLRSLLFMLIEDEKCLRKFLVNIQENDAGNKTVRNTQMH